MYSDASSHSWIVADMPRLSRIGLRIWPSMSATIQEWLLDRRRHAALKQDRLADLAERREQVEVLHVPRADLENVDVRQHPFDLRDLHHLGYRREVELVAGRAQELQPFHAHPLERVRRRARL